jgi:polysaccharide pyruvyl transferase WcaK-like protein
MRRVHLIDTSVASDNVGDEIIVRAAERELWPLIGDAYVSRSAGHEGLGAFGRDLVRRADVVVMLGTNALSARYRLNRHFMWRVTWADLPALRGKVVLLGVGGNRDFDVIDRRQKWFLGQLLSRGHVHSVRDKVGERIVEAVGHRAVNTSCPTLWSLPGQVPRGKAARVVFTLSAHRPDASDAVLVEVLLELYPEVWFWPQQPRDLDYLRKLPGAERVRVLGANLPAYDELLAEAPIDVVGTRLHGTIRGLHHGRRSLAVVIDNRARDIGAETGLPVIRRDEVAGGLRARLEGEIAGEVTVPRAAIGAFLDQFRVAA